VKEKRGKKEEGKKRRRKGEKRGKDGGAKRCGVDRQRTHVKKKKTGRFPTLKG
jgi:hypothetical protein